MSKRTLLPSPPPPKREIQVLCVYVHVCYVKTFINHAYEERSLLLLWMDTAPHSRHVHVSLDWVGPHPLCVDSTPSPQVIARPKLVTPTIYQRPKRLASDHDILGLGETSPPGVRRSQDIGHSRGLAQSIKPRPHSHGRESTGPKGDVRAWGQEYDNGEILPVNLLIMPPFQVAGPLPARLKARADPF